MIRAGGGRWKTKGRWEEKEEEEVRSVFWVEKASGELSQAGWAAGKWKEKERWVGSRANETAE